MYKLFALIYLLFSVHGTATSQEQKRPHKLLRRDVCDGIDDTPVLYHRYLSDICRPKYEPSSEGVCDHIDYQTNSCLAFCQLSTRFIYGREFPLGVWCDGPPCEIAEFTKTLTWSIDMNPNFEKGLNDGISGGWQSKLTSDVGPRKMALEKPLKDGQCGYWSWVSIERTVCGTMSFQQPEADHCSGNMHNLDDYCVDDLRLNPDGTVDGTTIFVYTDCATRLPLPMNQQTSRVYRIPGVALDSEEISILSQGLGSDREPSMIPINLGQQVL